MAAVLCSLVFKETTKYHGKPKEAASFIIGERLEVLLLFRIRELLWIRFGHFSPDDPKHRHRVCLIENAKDIRDDEIKK